jgi:hypothetical protein
MMATAIQQATDFVILGPTLARGNKVLEAIHALYYLPENYKLVFAGTGSADQSLFKEVMALIKHDGLDDRVEFAGDPEQSDAIILPNFGLTKARNSVTGDSPEALASAILDVARARSYA